MSDTTAISWTDHTFNPWWGCSRVSPACRFCYADRDASRYGFSLWRRHGERRLLSDANWAKPAKWNRDAEKAGVRARVFCASMADVFEDRADLLAPRERLWEVVADTPHLDWQLLTKRIENVASMVPWWRDDWPPNVWIGTSVENQRFADQRIPKLMRLPAAVRFLSCEPLLGHIDLRSIPYRGDAQYYIDALSRRYRSSRNWEWGTDCSFGLASLRGIDWVIVGGESGPAGKRREMDPDWLTSLVMQCQSSRVPIHVKQDSGPRSGLQGRISDDAWALKQFPAAVSR